MSRRAGAALTALALALIAGCGVRAQAGPDILPTLPPPTATPTATQQATATSSPSPSTDPG